MTMATGDLTPLFSLLLLATQCWSGCSNSQLNVTLAVDCQCLKSKEISSIVQNIIQVSGLRQVTVITEGTGLCGDLTHLHSVLLVVTCSNYQSIHPLSSDRTTLSTIIIDCDKKTSQDIIFHFTSDRRSSTMESRLILPVYNFIVTKEVDINVNNTWGADLTATHFVTISRGATNSLAQSNLDRERYTTRLTCNPSIYFIRRVKGQGHRETLGTYFNGYYRNILPLRNDFNNFEGMQLKVTTVRYTPFTMGRSSHYYGFCIDLLDTIAEDLNFTYDIIYSVDRKFGIKKSNGQWNGMIGMMERKEVDMVVAGLTITSHREEVVDFTVPFFEETSAVLVRVNLTKEEDLWKYFFVPLKLNVWLIIAGSLVVCGFIIRAVETVSDTIKGFHHNNGTHNKKLSLTESIWFMFTAYIKQGSVQLPSATSTQATMAFFWLMALLVGSAYTANLTASLATTRQAPPFNTLQELADDTDYRILLNGGSVQRLLLEGSSSGVYAALWRKINKTRSVSLQSSSNRALKLMFKEDEGVKYAVTADKTSLETKLYRDYPSKCDWAFIPETYFTSGLGIALPQNSPYKPLFDEAVMKVIESGLMQKWKKQHFLRSTCRLTKMGTQKDAKAINIGHIKILLVIVAGGLVLAAITFLIEVLGPISEKISQSELYLRKV